MNAETLIEIRTSNQVPAPNRPLSSGKRVEIAPLPTDGDAMTADVVEMKRQVMQAVEAERHRLGRELHDGAAQVVTAAIYAVDRCLTSRLEMSDEVRSAFKEIRSLLEECSLDMYQVVSDLRPRIVDDLGLGSAVRWYAQRWSRESGIAVELDVDENLQLPKDVEHGAFRILQEALANVRKHAEATRVKVEYRQSGRTILVRVCDNGVGFTPSSRKQTGLGANGLSGMSERALLLGGRLHLQSIPGEGTRLEVRFTTGDDACVSAPAGFEHTSTCAGLLSLHTALEDAPCLASRF